MPAITWIRASITRENMRQQSETFTTYSAERFPGWRIEKWEPGTWATFDARGTFCNTRDTLAAAKEVLAFLATH